MPFEEDEKDPSIWFLDHSYLENMFRMFKKVNGERAAREGGREGSRDHGSWRGGKVEEEMAGACRQAAGRRRRQQGRWLHHQAVPGSWGGTCWLASRVHACP